MKKRTIARYGKFRLTMEQGWIDHREMWIVFTIGTIAGLILLGKFIGLDVMSTWISMR